MPEASHPDLRRKRQGNNTHGRTVIKGRNIRNAKGLALAVRLLRLNSNPNYWRCSWHPSPSLQPAVISKPLGVRNPSCFVFRNHPHHWCYRNKYLLCIINTIWYEGCQAIGIGHCFFLYGSCVASQLIEDIYAPAMLRSRCPNDVEEGTSCVPSCSTERNQEFAGIVQLCLDCWSGSR